MPVSFAIRQELALNIYFDACSKSPVLKAEKVPQRNLRVYMRKRLVDKGLTAGQVNDRVDINSLSFSGNTFNLRCTQTNYAQNPEELFSSVHDIRRKT